MGKSVVVLGDTGSGKSSSIENLDPKSTLVISVIKGKDLPFRGSRKVWNRENKNLVSFDSYQDILNALKYTDEKTPDVKTIVIDDARYLMVKEFFSRAKENGYVKFTEIAMHFQELLRLVENVREDLTVVLMLHDDDVESEKIIVKKKVKLTGKLVEEQYNPLEGTAICLYACCTLSKEASTPTYQFYTNKTWINGIEIPAKSPKGMFETITIPNDLSLVVKAIEEYYG